MCQLPANGSVARSVTPSFYCRHALTCVCAPAGRQRHECSQWQYGLEDARDQSRVQVARVGERIVASVCFDFFRVRWRVSSALTCVNVLCGFACQLPGFHRRSVRLAGFRERRRLSAVPARGVCTAVPRAQRSGRHSGRRPHPLLRVVFSVVGVCAQMWLNGSMAQSLSIGPAEHMRHTSLFPDCFLEFSVCFLFVCFCVVSVSPQMARVQFQCGAVLQCVFNMA